MGCEMERVLESSANLFTIFLTKNIDIYILSFITLFFSKAH